MLKVLTAEQASLQARIETSNKELKSELKRNLESYALRTEELIIESKDRILTEVEEV